MKPTIIEDVNARKILDSRGNWTIEVDIITRFGFGRAAAPSGASTGKYEVIAFPEGGVGKALIEVEEVVCPELKGMDSEEQDIIDGILKELDGTEDFSNIGGNTAVAISMANAKAAASSLNEPLYKYLGGNFTTELPFPLGNVIGGGAHANNATDIQEFLVIPVGAKDVSDAICVNSEVHKKTKKILSKSGTVNLGKGDEGAWAPDIGDREALDTLSKVCREVGNEYGIEIRLGMDVAASEMWDSENNVYVYKREGKKRDTGEQIDYITSLIEDYNLYYVEDPIREEDFDGFAEITGKAGCLICGDDLYVTRVDRIEEGIKRNSSNSVLIKPNQCGTLTDTFNAINVAKNNNLLPVVSHRSGETCDDTIAHLAVAFKCPVIKTGAVGGERIAKLNELIVISEELTSKRARMAKLPL